MNKKRIRRVNGGIAICYGIGSIVGAIAGLIGMGVWVFKVITDQSSFSWGTLAGLTIATALLGAIGYSLFRVGYEGVEK